MTSSSQKQPVLLPACFVSRLERALAVEAAGAFRLGETEKGIKLLLCSSVTAAMFLKNSFPERKFQLAHLKCILLVKGGSVILCREEP